MLYTAMTKKAMQLAYKAHHEQFDKNGVPYIFHPIHLAEQMQDESTTVCALLHDVVEDTALSLDDLKKEGYPADVLVALALLTHDDSVPYLDYVRNIKANPIARAVKLVDLYHNSDLTRLDSVDAAAMARAAKYKKAINLLLQP